MVERQDIDALLIGALYGELTAAEEKRLAAHLESHPADKALFADLTHARELVRESRLLETQIEPPKQISTLLLQEAARRAPREEKDGWLSRFLRSLVAHPAMAAAMMLVVVIGFAAIVTQREGDHFAGSEESVTSKSATPAAEPVAAVGAAAEVAEMTDRAGPADPATASGAPLEETAAPDVPRGGAASEQYAVTLAEDRGEEAEPTPTKRSRKASSRPGDVVAAVPAKPAPATKGSGAQRAAKKEDAAAAVGALELRAAEPQPKDFDDEASAPRTQTSTRTARASEAPRAPVATGSYASPQPAPPPPAAQIARDERAPVAQQVTGRAKLASPPDDKPADPQLAWAQQQHAQLIAQVRAGNCSRAAGFAVSLESRAPGYYAKHVANDRSLKSCQPYITAEREKAAEARASRAKQSSSSEPSAPAKPAPSKAH